MKHGLYCEDQIPAKITEALDLCVFWIAVDIQMCATESERKPLEHRIAVLEEAIAEAKLHNSKCNAR